MSKRFSLTVERVSTNGLFAAIMIGGVIAATEERTSHQWTVSIETDYEDTFVSLYKALRLPFDIKALNAWKENA